MICEFCAIAASVVLSPPDQAEKTAWPVCEGKRERFDACVHDGDTFWYRGEKFRLVKIDAPEVGHHARCERERRLGIRSRNRLRRLLPGEKTIERHGIGKWGRPLVSVTVDGRDVEDALISARLAQVWTGRRADWCGG